MSNFKIDSSKKIETGFVVPDGYFDHITEVIAEKAIKRSKHKVVRLYVTRLAVAACFILVLGLGFLYKTDSTYNKQPSAQEIENYLVYRTNVSAYDLGQNLDEHDFKELQGSMAVSNETIENYILDNDITE